MFYYLRNPRPGASQAKSELKMLEVDAARWGVSLATYLRISLFVKARIPYDVPPKLLKELSRLGSALDEFEKTGYLHPGLGYPIFKYLEKHPEEDLLDPIFRTRMKDPPLGGRNFIYWRPADAIGVEDVAYEPWTTPEHLQLLRSYPFNQNDKEVIAYHLRGPLEDNIAGLVEGLAPIYQHLQTVYQQYQGLGGTKWKEHSHTQQLPVMIDLLNEYLATDVVIPTEQVWLQRSKKKALPPRNRPLKAKLKKRKPKKKNKSKERL